MTKKRNAAALLIVAAALIITFPYIYGLITNTGSSSGGHDYFKQKAYIFVKISPICNLGVCQISSDSVFISVSKNPTASILPLDTTPITCLFGIQLGKIQTKFTILEIPDYDFVVPRTGTADICSNPVSYTDWFNYVTGSCYTIKASIYDAQGILLFEKTRNECL